MASVVPSARRRPRPRLGIDGSDNGVGNVPELVNEEDGEGVERIDEGRMDDDGDVLLTDLSIARGRWQNPRSRWARRHHRKRMERLNGIEGGGVGTNVDDGGCGSLDWETFEFGTSPKMDRRFVDSSDDGLGPKERRLERIDDVLRMRTRHARFLFENPSNPSNVYACLRTLDSFGIQYVDVVVTSSAYEGKAAMNQKRFLCAFFHRPGKGRGPNGGWRGVLINNYKLVFISFVATLVLSKCLLENQPLFFVPTRKPTTLFWTSNFFRKLST
jgi:hypothetical protein